MHVWHIKLLVLAAHCCLRRGLGQTTPMQAWNATNIVEHSQYVCRLAAGVPEAQRPRALYGTRLHLALPPAAGGRLRK